MNDEEKEFEKLAVMLLFKRIREGRVTLDTARTPHLKASLGSVQFDGDDQPIMDSVSPQVRLLATTIANEEANQFEDALNKTGDFMGIDALLPIETEVTDAVLGKCQSEDDFTRLAFELFKEAACLTSVASCAYKTELPTKFPWERSQAVCAGLLIRAVKFMQAIARLYASGDSAEVNLALGRCIMEAAVNVRFLLKKNSQQLFDDFVRYSFVAEREQVEWIQKDITGCDGKVLPIQQRMLDSIDRCLADSGVQFADIPDKGRIESVVGSLWKRLDALGIARRITGHQAIPSHAIHGDWADLVLFHLTHESGHYGPQTDFCPEEPGSFLPLSLVVLEATNDYLHHFYPKALDSETLLRRIQGLVDRITRVTKSHEMSRSQDSGTIG